jgi:uncharacterized metal-binding protein
MAEKRDMAPDCADCAHEVDARICMQPKGKSHTGCPTLTQRELLRQSNREYERPEILRFAQQASRQEADCYANRDQQPYIMQPTKPRILEICEFARKMSYKKLGLAFCVGLAKEARVVEEILSGHGFDVVSVLCKAGRSSKDIIQVPAEDRINRGSDESMCNPIFQANLLNNEKTDFNVLLGLCVGHDSLFFKYAEAPTTVLAVKDRVTGHNPLAAIYLVDSYYRKLRHPEFG